MSFLEFLDMGGYSFYVWSAWGLSSLTLIIMASTAVMKRRNLHRQVQTQLHREALISSVSSSDS